ncbi:MAG: helix-turn-helix transcriptional regulator [Saprospiraceae bacterium]
MVHAGQKIKFLRESKGWSREQLADKIHKSVETIAKTEQCKRALTMDEAELFGEIFEVDPSYFFKKSNGIVFKNIKNSPAVGFHNTVSVDQNLLSSVIKTLDKMAEFLTKKST